MARPGYEGYAALGELLGGGIGKPGVYEDTLKKAYSTDEQLQQARRARSQAMIDAGRLESRNSVTTELLQAALGGDINAQAALGASVLGSNQTMSLGQLGDYQRPHYGQNVNAAQEALGSGDIGTYNKFNAAAEGKSYQPTMVLGGAYMADGADVLGGDSYVPTLPTMTGQMRAESAVSQGQQRTDAAVAKSGRIPSSGGGGGKAPTAASAENAELARARAAVQSGADPGQVADMLRKRGFPTLAKKIYAPGGK